jgi:hypothetical protein
VRLELVEAVGAGVVEATADQQQHQERGDPATSLARPAAATAGATGRRGVVRVPVEILLVADLAEVKHLAGPP